MTRRRRALRLTAAATGVASALALLAGWLERPRLEGAVRARIAAEAARRGLLVNVETVRVGLWPPLALRGVRVERPGAWSVTTDAVDVTLRPWGRGLVGRARIALGRVTAAGPGALQAEAAPTLWDIRSAGSAGWRAELRAPASGLAVTWLPAAGGGRLELDATELPAGRLVTLRRGGLLLLDGGILGGAVRLTSAPAATVFDVDVTSHGLRVSALSGDAAPAEPPAFGQPTDVALRLDGSWRPRDGALELPRWRVTVDGAALFGSLSLEDASSDPRVDLSLEIERLDFARLFRTSGLDRPEAVAVRLAAAHTSDLGSASLSVRIKGRVADPASFTVTQRLDFTPPPRMPPAIDKLRGDFAHEVTSAGERRTIDVSPASPDFVALGDVPPLFLRTLLLGEDAGFYGHRGIDFGELPSAILTDWARGGAIRGASTITQQLAKNLFLSPEKRLGRKLQELSLALLLESALGKQRILEIYLNVIEWGPGLYGLRPAARRYFHKEPRDLTPGQAALLVALIPGPIKYQRSLAGGTPPPWLRSLVDALLTKLCTVGELDDDAYQAALAEELVVDTTPPGATADPPTLTVTPEGG